MIKAHNSLDIVCPSCKSEHTTFLWENDYAMNIFSGCIKCKSQSPEYHYGRNPDIPATHKKPKEFSFEGFDNAVKALNQYLSVDVYNCTRVYVEIAVYGVPGERIKSNKNLVKHFGGWLFNRLTDRLASDIGTMTLHLSAPLPPNVAMKIGRGYNFIGCATDSFLALEGYTGPLPGCGADDVQSHWVLINYNSIVAVDVTASTKNAETEA